MDSGFTNFGIGGAFFGWSGSEIFLQLFNGPGFPFKAMKNVPENNQSPAPDRGLEARLETALKRLPNVPVPSNFTARVLDAVELEESRAARSGRQWNWRSLFPRLAVGTAVLLVVGISIQHYETNSHRVALAKEIASVAASNPLPDLEVLENLDVIQRIGASNHADADLLAALE